MKNLLASLLLLFALGCDAEPKGRPQVVDLSAPVTTEEGDYTVIQQDHGVTMPDGSTQHILGSTLKWRTYKGLTDFQYSIVDRTAGTAPLHAALNDEDAEGALAIDGEAFSLRPTNGGKYVVNNLHIFDTQEQVSDFLLASGLNDKVTREQLALLSWNIDMAVEGTKWGFIKKTIASIFKPILDKWAEGK